MDLRVILNSIIPDNIKRIALVQKCTDVFAEMLSRDSNIAYRIQKLFDVDNSVFYRRDDSDVLVPDVSSENLKLQIKREADVTRKKTLEGYKEYRDYIAECKNTLKKGLFYTYLAVMFSLIEELCRDSFSIDTIKKRNLDRSKIFENVYDTVNSEYLGAFRYFQQCSGTENAIRYIYQFSRYLETGVLDNSLDLESGDPFFLVYNGELHKSVFQVFNMPLAHPCGWCFQYNTITRQMLTDYYGIRLTYNINSVVLQWKSKKIYFCALPDDVDTNNVVWERAIETVEEKLRNNEIVHVISDRTPRPDGQHLNRVNLVVTSVDVQDTGTLITFDTGNALYIDKTNASRSKGYTVKFGDVTTIYTSGYVFPENTKLLPFDNAEPEYQILYKDQMVLEDTLEPSSGSGAVCYNDDFSNAFRLVGDTYPYCPGVDESRHRVTNATNTMDKFTVTVNYRSSNITYLRIEDDFGHFCAVVRDTSLTLSAQNQFKVNTHGYYGEFLTFKAFDGLSYNYDHYIRTNLLNKTSGTIKVSGFSIENNKLKFKAQSSLSSLRTTVTIGTNVITKNTGPILNFNEDTSSYALYGSFKIEITNFDDTVIIEGNGLNNTSYNFYFSLPEYPSETVIKPVFVNCTPDTMSDRPQGKSLGALNKTPTLTWFKDTFIEDPHYIKPDSTVYVSELLPATHDGTVFINRGYSKSKSDSLDTMNVSCTKYMTDEFYCETSGASNWLMFDNSAIDGSLGKYLVCRFNSDPQTGIRGMLRGYVLTFY